MSRPERQQEPAHSVEAVLNYLVYTGEKPASYGGIGSSTAAQKRKGTYREYPTMIHDGRAIADQLSLERQGFTFVTHETRMRDFYDEQEVRSVYYREIEQLVKEASGAQRVVVFDHTLRSADDHTRDEKSISGPVRNVHNDYTEWSGPQRVRDLLPDEADELLRHRFAVIQVWRPINNRVQREPLAIADGRTIGSQDRVQREPLAIADGRTIGSQDLVPSARVYPDRIGEVYHITHNPDHRWYYFPNMQRNEAIVFKCYDSKTDGRARWTAHAAFDDPSSPPGAPPRESIEMRTLAFFPVDS